MVQLEVKNGIKILQLFKKVFLSPYTIVNKLFNAQVSVNAQNEGMSLIHYMLKLTSAYITMITD